MALTRAVVAGAIAAVGMPMAMKGLDNGFGDFVMTHSVHFQLFDVWLRWSWTVFAVVTLFAWLAFKAAKGR